MEHQNRIKPIAPYGKELAYFLEWNVQPRNDVFIFCGINAWNKAKELKGTQFVLCLPLENKPTDYIWPVKNCPILLFDTGGLDLVDLEVFSYHLLKSQARIIRLIQFNGVMIIYKITL